MPLNELRATEWAAPPAGPLGSTKNGGRETTQTAGGGNPTLYRRGGKRLLDTALAATGLLLASPLLLICGAAIWLDSPGRIFFRQRRVGQGGKPFDIVKFRTMVERAEQMGSRLTAGGDSRVTRVGKWLRKTKLDELPQLFNVLKGEMSLVGPRPEVPEYVAAYNEEQIRVLDLRPGITGLASLAYIDEEKLLANEPDKEAFYLKTLMPQKLELDLFYGENVSFLTDTQMIFATLAKLVHPAEKLHAYLQFRLLPSRSMGAPALPEKRPY